METSQVINRGRRGSGSHSKGKPQSEPDCKISAAGGAQRNGRGLVAAPGGAAEDVRSYLFLRKYI